MAHNSHITKDSVESIFEKKIPNYPVVLSNLLLGSPLDYTLLERRFMYKVISLIKRPHPGVVPDIDKESLSVLTVDMPREFMAEIGGAKNIKRTANTLMELSHHPIVQYVLKDNELAFSIFRWLGGITYTFSKKQYTISVTPEFYMYAACVQDKFTYFDINVGNLLKTKYSQKFYEICCMYTGKGTEDYRFYDPLENEMIYKKRVLKLSIEAFRFTFGLNHQFLTAARQEQTTDTFKFYADIERRILRPCREELYKLYKEGISHVWFDYHPRHEGPQGTVTDIDIFFYTSEHPKSADAEKNRPWTEGDEELNPFERKATPEELRNNRRSFKPITDGYTDYYFRNASKGKDKEKLVEIETNRHKIKKALSEVNRQDTLLKTTEQETKKAQTKRGEPEVDIKQFVIFFNSMATRYGSSIQHIVSMEPPRQKALKSACKKYGKTTLIRVLQNAFQSDFLNGRTGAKFCANVDWILKEDNFEKIAQGKYNRQ